MMTRAQIEHAERVYDRSVGALGKIDREIADHESAIAVLRAQRSQAAGEVEVLETGLMPEVAAAKRMRAAE